MTATNNKPNLVQQIPGGTRHDALLLRVGGDRDPRRGDRRSGRRPANAALATRVTPDDGYTIVQVDFRERPVLQAVDRRSASTYDLPGGAPRSDSDIRVGSAFATFYAWAFGDRGDVRIVVPAGFEVETSGSTDRGDRRGRRHDAVAPPASRTSHEWYAVVVADRRDALTQRPARPAGRRAPRRSGPGPRTTSGGRGSATCSSVGPAGPRREDRARLAGRGRPRGRRGPHAAARGLRRGLLHGRGPDRDQRGPRRADDRPRGVARLVQPTLFVGRWINEGFADEYASRVLDEVSVGGLGPGHGQSPTTDGAIDLNDWAHPGRIADDETEQPRALRLRGVVDGRPGARRRDRRGRRCGRSSPPPTPTQTAYRRCGRAGDGRRSRTTGGASSTSSRRPAAPTNADETVPALGRQRPTRRRCSTPGRDARAAYADAGRRRRRLAAGLRRPRPAGPLGVRAGRRRRSTRRRRCSRCATSIAARAAELGVAPPTHAARGVRGGDRRISDAVRDLADDAARDGDGRSTRQPTVVAAERDVVHLDRADRRGPGRGARPRRRPRSRPATRRGADAAADAVAALMTGAADAGRTRALVGGLARRRRCSCSGRAARWPSYAPAADERRSVSRGRRRAADRPDAGAVAGSTVPRRRAVEPRPDPYATLGDPRPTGADRGPTGRAGTR